MPTSNSSDVVILQDGRSVSLAALRLGWTLEARGFVLQPEGEKLRVQPHDQLTAADVAAIRAHRDELLELARACEVM